MAKKGFIITFILLILTITTGLWGTNILMAQRDDLSSQVATLERDKQNLQTEIYNQKVELTELKNTPKRLLEQVKTAFKEKNYELAKVRASTIVQTYVGSPEVEEAEWYLEEVEHKMMILSINQQQEEARQKAEEQEQQKLDAVANKEKLRSIIRIKSITTSKPDYEGGVDFSFIWQNRSDKVVKYLHVSVSPFNAVDDPVTCLKTKESMKRGSLIGPVKAGAWYGEGYRWDNMWFNNIIKIAHINSIVIEYMDGSDARLNEEDIKQVIY